MKQIRLFTIVMILLLGLGLLTVSLAAAGGLQQAGGDDPAAELAADQAGGFTEVTAGTGSLLVCPAGTIQETLYFSDLEADNGGWTVSGFGDWEWGQIVLGVHEFCDTTPRPEPPGPFSGLNVWANNLNGCYQNSGDMSFLSQSFDLSGIPAPIEMSWWNWHEVFGSFDVIRVNVNGSTLWEDTSSGATTQWLSETVDLSTYAGNAAVTVEYELEATTVVNRSGWYVDDIAINYCRPQQPGAVLTKTVGTDPNACATSTTLDVPAGFGGTDVTYCYTVENTGEVTFTDHVLIDDQLGTIGPLSMPLGPGQTDFVTFTTLITQTTVNVATYTGSVPGGPSASSSATATVTQLPPTGVSLTQFGNEAVGTSHLWLAVLMLVLVGWGWLVFRRRRQV